MKHQSDAKLIATQWIGINSLFLLCWMRFGLRLKCSYVTQLLIEMSWLVTFFFLLFFFCSQNFYLIFFLFLSVFLSFLFLPSFNICSNFLPFTCWLKFYFAFRPWWSKPFYYLICLKYMLSMVDMEIFSHLHIKLQLRNDPDVGPFQILLKSKPSINPLTCSNKFLLSELAAWEENV